MPEELPFLLSLPPVLTVWYYEGLLGCDALLVAPGGPIETPRTAALQESSIF